MASGWTAGVGRRWWRRWRTSSPPVVGEALRLLGECFETTEHDGPIAYASFLAATPADPEAEARLRREAVAAVREFLRAFRSQIA